MSFWFQRNEGAFIARALSKLQGRSWAVSSSGGLSLLS